MGPAWASASPRGIYWVVIWTDAMTTLADRITVDPAQCGGRPCVRGLRIRVTDVLDLLASGLSPDAVIESCQTSQLEDVSACLRFASRRLAHPIVAA